MLQGINHITLAVKEIERSFLFYRDVLGFKPLCRWERGAYFMIGDLWFCLNVDDLRVPNPCYTHYAFTVSLEDFEGMKQKVIDSGALIFKEYSLSGDSFYFLDPDGHKLEIHTGNWKSRIALKQRDLGSWKEVEWFE